MGLGGISPGSLLLIFFIVLILFGTKKLRTIGEDLGQAVRGFRKALNQEDGWENTTQMHQTTHLQTAEKKPSLDSEQSKQNNSFL